MYKKFIRYKKYIHIALIGMFILNLVMACAVLKPPESVQEETVSIPQKADPDSPEPRMSTAQKIGQVDQEVRALWVSLLPFWDE